MFTIFKQAGIFLLNLVFSTGALKFLGFGLLFLLVELVIQVLWDLLPDWMTLNGIFSFMTPEMWWFLDLINFSFGAPLILSAYATRFLIRRLPIIG